MTITLFCEVDCVLLGAEGVCESGGIVNQLGTLPVALIAKQVGKKACFILNYVQSDHVKMFRHFYWGTPKNIKMAFFCSLKF